MIEGGCVNIKRSAKLSKTVLIRGNGSIYIGEYAIIEDNVMFDTGKNIKSKIIINDRSKIKYGCVLRTYDGYIDIGKRTSIGEYSVLNGNGGLCIGHCVIVAGHCYFASSNHISTSNTQIRFQGDTAKGINIQDNCWIGAQCCILDGVKVGKNTIIGAGSIITRDMPESHLCKGTPCHIDRKIILENEIRNRKGEKNVRTC